MVTVAELTLLARWGSSLALVTLAVLRTVPVNVLLPSPMIVTFSDTSQVSSP
jgi:hypothetical protein